VQNRWCYPIEGVCKVLQSTCKNKNKIEACIAGAQILQEVSNFTTKYYVEHLPSMHNRPRRYNTGENESNLGLFRGQLRQMAEVHQKQMEALQSAHNQQFASVLQYLENLGHAVAPQVQLPPLPQVQLPPLPQAFFPPLARPATISPVSYFETCYFF
jgi:hypothetical protein